MNKSNTAQLVKEFVPKSDLNKLDRGKEFSYLQSLGKNINETIALYKKHGIPVAVATVYNSLRIADSPSFVRSAIAKGEVKPSEVLPILAPRAYKGMTHKERNELIKEKLEAIIAQRSERHDMLEKAGFTSESGELKLTRLRTVKLVGKSLAKIRSGKAITSVRAQAIKEFIEALDEGATADELVKLALKR